MSPLKVTVRFAARSRLATMLLATALALGCHPSASEVVEQAHRAFASFDRPALENTLSHAYLDALGDREVLLADLDVLKRRFARARIKLPKRSTLDERSARRNTVIADIDAEFVGDQTWKLDGSVRIELEREDGPKIASGLLTELRDIIGLMDRRRAAFEANDPEGFDSTLHPNYRDGDIDRNQAVQRFARDIGQTPVRLFAMNYRLELRGANAHLDEHYILSVGSRTFPPAIARFTLARSAGRWRIQAGLYAGDSR
ncbi:MAG: hypothetical protein IPK13_23350 [Deltaproteobacteria bacterium]|nr:hypothetical protein [Deltaproteobacteria bacterium]